MELVVFSISMYACSLQFVILIRLEGGMEYLIQAPDQTTRSEWRRAIEDVVRKLEQLYFSADCSTMKLIDDRVATTTTKR